MHGAGAADLLTAAVAALVLVAIAGALYTHRFGLSHLLVFMAVGMLAGIDGPLGLPFDNHAVAVHVGNLALALILFDGGLRSRWAEVRDGILPAGLLATVGVAATACGVAVIGHLVLGLAWMDGLLLGAAVSSTDASAVFAQFSASQLKLQNRLAATIEVESAMNDPMAMVLTVGLIAWISSRGATPDASSLEVLTPLLAQQLGLGVLVGVVAGVICAAWIARLPIRDDHDGLAALLMAALGLLLFAVTNRCGGSGFLAVYLAGLLVRHRAERVAVMSLPGLNGYTWLAQAALFLLLGLLVTPHEVWRLAGPGLAVAAGLMLLARPLAVVLCLAPLRFGWRDQCFVAWSGLRGGVPIVLAAYPVLANLPGAWKLFDVAFLVVLLSLMIQGPTLAPLARALGINRKPE
ncbi:potassium/proton antiporter [Pelomonas cellulosilytica]|uniref:Potassium/proton antiporter n=1 Tax=Pelomonas cellulosilytica TaxID=2906762 RepID=A0ABS8Y1T8_9BURK|nr:potassium/proton antiporter [Pelomonas sp. P8]MCE4557605.1 potassium/proton antiporter [Pelomonas sp. P8]